MRVTLVHGQHRDGVYYWSKLVTLQSSALALSSLARSSLAIISMWHSHLGHSSLPIFEIFLVFEVFLFLKNTCVPSLVAPAILIKATSYLLLNQASLLLLHLMSSFLMCGPHSFPIPMVFITTLFLSITL